jgi:hypothetical protein
MYLIVDEALTAIRCGAPFAHQLKEYCEYKPSFVFFGKGLRTNGIGICWDGVVVHQWGYTNMQEIQEDTLLGWDMDLSEAFTLNSLTLAWGTLLCARNEDWPGRARRVGQNLRKYLSEQYPETTIKGRGAYLYIPRIRPAMTVVLGAGSRVPAIRWFPPLDVGMDDPDVVESLFGPGSHSLRNDLKNRIAGYCTVCADYPDGDLSLCERCFSPICEGCRNKQSPEAKRHHQLLCLSIDTDTDGMG